MHDLNIRHLVARYRLPSGTAAEQREKERLDEVLKAALETAADVALARAGIPEDEQICIHRLEVPVRLRLAAPDAGIALDISVRFAQALVAALARGGSNVVRYTSRREALVDLLVCVARGDLSRAWAWRQTGLWNAPQSLSPGLSFSEAARVLARERAVVPVLCAVARQAGLDAYVQRLASDEWVGLAGIALVNAQGPAASRALSDLGGEASASSRESDTGLGIGHRLRHSVLFTAAKRALEKMGLVEPERRRSGGSRSELRLIRALAVVSALELDPALPGRADATFSKWIRAIEGHLVDPARVKRGESRDNATPAAQGGAQPMPPRHHEAPRRASLDNTGPSRSSALVGVQEKTYREERTDDDRSPTSNHTPTSSLPHLDLRRRGPTHYGGLLFLLNLLEPLEIPKQLCETPLLESRPLRFCLHRLGLSLVHLDIEDPAALAFAGLGPDAEPPSVGEPPPSPDELGLLARLAEDMVALLRRRLHRSAATRADLLTLVCRRRAMIVADPGWIEVQLEHDEVSVELRRAGLDLDPGWLRWLGTVVKFRYV